MISLQTIAKFPSNAMIQDCQDKFPNIKIFRAMFSRFFQVGADKSPNKTKFLSLSKFTFVNMESEATSGTDLVKKCVQNLVAGTGLERVALVDAFGYDAFPALATLEAGKCYRISN